MIHSLIGFPPNILNLFTHVDLIVIQTVIIINKKRKKYLASLKGTGKLILHEYLGIRTDIGAIKIKI